MEDIDPGVFCKKNATFYYMEYGNVPTPKTSVVERIVKTLVARDLIEFTTDQGARPERQYEIITVRLAKDRNIKMEPIYASDHIRKTMEEAAQVPDKKSGWGRKPKES